MRSSFAAPKSSPSSPQIEKACTKATIQWGREAFLLTCRASTPQERMLCLLSVPSSAPQALGTKATP